MLVYTGQFINGCCSAQDARECTHDFLNKFVMWKFFVQGSDDFCHNLWRSLQQGPIWSCTLCSSWLLYIFATIQYMHPYLFHHRWGYYLLWMWRMKHWWCSWELSSEFGLSWCVADVVEPSVWAQQLCQDPAAPQSDCAEVLVVEVVGGGGVEILLLPLWWWLCISFSLVSFCWAWGCCACSLFLFLMVLGLLFLPAEWIWWVCLLALSVGASSVRGLTIWGWCGPWDECTAMGGILLALVVCAGNFAVFAVKFCMAVPATSEAHRGFTSVVGLAVSSAWSLCSDLTPLFGTMLLSGGGFGEGVHCVCPLSGFGTGAGWGWGCGCGWGWFLDDVVLLGQGTGHGGGTGALPGEPVGVNLRDGTGVCLGGGDWSGSHGDGTGVAHGKGFFLCV